MWPSPRTSGDTSWTSSTTIAGWVSLSVHDGWIAFFDIDQFFVIPGRDAINDVLDRAPSGGYSAIGVNQRLFGSNGEDVSRNEPVLDRFPYGGLISGPLAAEHAAVERIARGQPT